MNPSKYVTFHGYFGQTTLLRDTVVGVGVF